MYLSPIAKAANKYYNQAFTIKTTEKALRAS
jgi:hypothetical protein